ncbi:MAG: 16S rRNA (adenine(1518)-N(6)/adenine(1519)-N(6))-dimethyltransferase RsmA, partial [Planctomycetota bacterium]|nr:16S rRNA (adenine(1518)-N(6)/adenine(1519)-N(6))-dimethyltransferase RsmA [Planctomycetota bacterium]
MAHRQTAQFLIQRFRQVGIKPVTKRGQNFLIDLNLVELIAESADLGPDDVVLEVGTGTGSLTALIAPHVAEVVTVEIDRQLHELANQELVEFDNVTFLCQDVLRTKNRLHPVVLEMLQEKLAGGENRKLKLVANLPYNVATPIISNLLDTEVVPDAMSVTIQKELADRIVASPSTKDYGSLSIWLQSQCDVQIVRTLPPSVFWPRPKVQSAILHIQVSPEKRGLIADVTFFHRFVRAMFFHRRKYLRSVILSAFKGQLDKPAVDAVLEAQALSPQIRAEALDVQQMLDLCD